MAVTKDLHAVCTAHPQRDRDIRRTMILRHADDSFAAWRKERDPDLP